MKIHPDGTLEGTAEELAAYQSKMADAKKLAERVQQRQDARPWKHPNVGIGTAGWGGCIYTSDHHPTVMLNTL